MACSVCTHPSVREINAALRAGAQTLASLSREHSVSYAALKRHRQLGHPDLRGDYNPGVDVDVPALPTEALPPESAFARLKPKHRVFVEEYLVDLCARRAAIRSGYSSTSADQAAWRLMQRPDVIGAIQELQAIRHRRTVIGAQWVADQLLTIATLDLADLFEGDGEGRLVLKDLSKIPPEIRRAIRKVVHTKHGVTVELESRLEALKLLLDFFGGRHQGATEFYDLNAWDPLPTVEELSLMADGVPAQTILAARTTTTVTKEVVTCSS